VDDNVVTISICLICLDGKNWDSALIISFDVFTNVGLVDVNDRFHIIRSIALQNSQLDRRLARSS
jgi:hypothetical protein